MQQQLYICDSDKETTDQHPCVNRIFSVSLAPDSSSRGHPMIIRSPKTCYPTFENMLPDTLTYVARHQANIELRTIAKTCGSSLKLKSDKKSASRSSPQTLSMQWKRKFNTNSDTSLLPNLNVNIFVITGPSCFDEAF